MLLFKKRFLPAIRAGTKTQTLRLWPYRRMRSGQRSYIPGAGYIQVELVEEIQFEQLTDDDARRDGFETLAALRAELETIYNEHSREYKLFRVRFRLIEPRRNAARD
jgi:hypothetical protein